MRFTSSLRGFLCARPKCAIPQYRCPSTYTGDGRPRHDHTRASPMQHASHAIISQPRTIRSQPVRGGVEGGEPALRDARFKTHPPAARVPVPRTRRPRRTLGTPTGSSFMDVGPVRLHGSTSRFDRLQKPKLHPQPWLRDLGLFFLASHRTRPEEITAVLFTRFLVVTSARPRPRPDPRATSRAAHARN